MSAGTKTALENAINAHIAEEYGDLTAHWTVVAGVVSNEGDNAVVIESPSGMPAYIQRGLLGEAAHLLDFGDEDDDE